MKPTTKAPDRVEEFLPALAVLVLLILTPWPAAMMIISGLGILGCIVFSRNMRQKGALIILGISFAIGAGAALLLP